MKIDYIISMHNLCIVKPDLKVMIQIVFIVTNMQCVRERSERNTSLSLGSTFEMNSSEMLF